MEIQLISSSSFFQIFLLSPQHFTGLIPNTMLCDEGNISSWIFNSQKQPQHPILRKNKQNLFTIKFIKQLISSLNCQHIIQQTTSVSQIYALLTLEIKKEDSQFKEYVNHTVMYCQRGDKVPKYIRVLDFIKSLSNRSFNEPQCPEGWCLFQEVVLSRMKQPESYFVEVFKLEGDMTFRFNYYKWVNRNAGKDEFSEPPCYRMEDNKDIVKVYEQNLTQKILVTVLQLISYLETNFRLEIRRLTARYTFNKHQDAVLKGISEIKVMAPKKFIDYNKVEADQTMTLSEYVEIQKKLQKLPEIMVSTVKIQKKSFCPGSFCDAILKEKLEGMEIGTPSQVISWSVIDSHSTPEIIRNLIEIGLIDIPNHSDLKKQSKPSNKSSGQGVKVCNKCSLVYKAIIKIQKAETDFESKQLKKFTYDYPSDPVKRSYNSKSAVTLKKNFIQNNISSLKSPPRGSYLNYGSPEKLPLIENTTREKLHKSSFKQTKGYRKVNNKSQSFEPIVEKYQNNKLQSPILKSLVGQKFKSKQQLKQLLYKHFKKRREQTTQKVTNKEKPIETQKHKQKSIVKQKSKDLSKSRHLHTQQQILNKMQNLIGNHQTTSITKNQRQLNVQKLSKKIHSELSHFQKLNLKINTYQVDGKMEINYCILTHSQSAPTKTLFIVNDAISSYFEFISTAASLITQDLRIVLFNYPGQAYTNFSNRKLSGIEFSEIMDRFVWHLNQEKLIQAEKDLILFCGVGYGGYILKYYLNMNYRYYPNWSAVLLINSSSSILPKQQKFIKRFMEERLTNNKSLFESYYKQYYRIHNDLVGYCRQYNEITDQGLIYLIKSQIDEQNEEIEIKSTKLKVVNKEISLTSQPIKSHKQRLMSKSPIPKKYPLIYDGKQSDNYQLVTSNKFMEVLQKFILKNSW